MIGHFDRRTFLKSAGTAVLAGGVVPRTRGLISPEESAIPVQDEPYGSCDPKIDVDLKAIEFNVAQLRKKTGGRPILAVLKCNAYGHGLIGVARCLEKIPVEGIVVGKLNEALALREAGIRLPILNLGPFSAADAETIVRQSISQGVFTDDVGSLNEWAGRLKVRASVHIKVDTGLGRVGVPYDAALSYIHDVSRLPHVRIDGVFQSFSEEPELDRIQLDRFLAVTSAAKKEGLSIGLRHASASTAIFRYGEEFYLDAVRPGISLYGHYPTSEEHQLKRLGLRPALSLKAYVAYVKTLKPGQSLSYFRKFVAEKNERIATVAMGYSDGIPQNLAGCASALVRGRRYPFIADVTANHSYLLVTGHSDIAPGDEVVVVGKQDQEEISLWDLAQSVGGSDYKILIGLNPSLRRTYIA